MTAHKQIPCALTIAGSDSGGGAGVQADLKTFAALQVHGTSVITCVTAQNPRQVLGVEVCRPASVRRQLEAVFSGLPPAAVKTGMLHSAPIVRTVAEFLRRRNVPLVVDPVMISTSGARLLLPPAVKAMCDNLLPLATVVTPNLDEAAALTGIKLQKVEDLRKAAKALRHRFGCAALVKGGHLRGLKEAVDIFYDGRQELLLTAPFIPGISTHGTGCTYSAALTGWLARGSSLTDAVVRAKTFITQAIVQSQRVGHQSVLNSFWR